jgi:hypothetical protein
MRPILRSVNSILPITLNGNRLETSSFNDDEDSSRGLLGSDTS